MPRRPEPTITPLVRFVDLNVGDAQEVELSGGKKVKVKLLDLKEVRDDLRDAVRKAEATIEIGGEKVTLTSANYRLPVTVAGVQVDCPVTKGYRANSSKGATGGDPWGLEKDARIRLWPAESPLMNPGTFMYPAKQRWFASGTQMANEPVHVDGGENPLNKSIYYHYGLDMGGAEGMVEVVAATDGLVISSGKAVLPGYGDSPARIRYDVVYLLDDRGWYYRYSHLHTIDAEIKPGVRLKMGRRIGVLGKEGASGGWSHLHFDIKPDDNVTFLVRTFRTVEGKETWDFGDGSPKEEVRSDGNAVALAKDGYARIIHRYKKAGHYLVRVERSNGRGESAIGHLQVRVGME